MADLATPGSPAYGRSTLAWSVHTLLRVGAGLLFMQHGAQKLLGSFGGFGGTPGARAELMSMMGLAGVLELVGGLLLVLGLLTRPVAAVLALQMVAAYFMAHASQGAVPLLNGGELALLYALVWAYFAGNGGGPYSLDARVLRGRAR